MSKMFSMPKFQNSTKHENHFKMIPRSGLEVNTNSLNFAAISKIFAAISKKKNKFFVFL